MSENTLVLFASDHGEMLNDHGLCQKGNPFDAATRVPLLARWPSRLPAVLAFSISSQQYQRPLSIRKRCFGSKLSPQRSFWSG